MATFRLDVNVLLALAWPNHMHHQAARRWLAALAPDQWATCPLTQCGFVRISCNPKITLMAAPPAAAVAALLRVMAWPGHVFWPDRIGFHDSSWLQPDRVRGHRQLTDAYLLALALDQRGHLATMDQGIASLAKDQHERAAITMVPT